MACPPSFSMFLMTSTTAQLYTGLSSKHQHYNGHCQNSFFRIIGILIIRSLVIHCNLWWMDR